MRTLNRTTILPAWVILVAVAALASAVGVVRAQEPDNKTADERAIRVRPADNPAVMRDTKDNWGIFIGVNQFESPSVSPLRYCSRDATALHDTLSGGDSLIPRNQSYLLVTGAEADRRPNRLNILRVVKYVCERAAPDSLILISISTHGFTGTDGKAYILPENGDPELLQDTAVSVDRINQMLADSKATKKILFVDACRENTSGGTKGATSAELTEQFKKALVAGKGQLTLSSCDEGQVSYEDSNKQHGVFTYYLIEGLAGNAHTNSDGFITLYTLFQYANRKTKQWCNVNLRPEQTPWLTGAISDEIPLAVGGVPIVPPTPRPTPAVVIATPTPAVIEVARVEAPRPTSTPTPRPTPRPTPQVITIDRSQNFKEDLGGGVMIEMVYVPGGTFTMGCSQDVTQLASQMGVRSSAFAPELPARKVTLSPFWISKHEITNAQFRAFKAIHDSGVYSRDRIPLNEPNQPVVNLRYTDATAFSAWLTSKTGKRYYLPTEAQWEYAARGGTNSVYYWGSEMKGVEKHENVMDLAAREMNPGWRNSFDVNDKFKITAPVGSFAPNAFGLHDMLGNVSEMCRDDYAAAFYKSGPTTNPLHDLKSTRPTYKAMRGGSWLTYKLFELRLTHRKTISSSRGAGPEIGFRIVHEAY